MGKVHKGSSRRDFLKKMSIVGGATAAHQAVAAFGLSGKTTKWNGPPQVPPGSGKGKSVLVLGAGIGGLTSAFRLARGQYQVTILEAANRAGGRSYTARRGDVVVEDRNGSRELQKCKFDKGLYVNLGPGRIPYHHVRMLQLCKELGVDLEVYVHTSAANLYRTLGTFNQAVIRRRLAYDAQGHLAQLMARAMIDRGLDLGLPDTATQKFLRFLQKFGSLNQDYRYEGSTRTGCRQPPSVAQGCVAPEPIPFLDMLNSEFWDPCLLGNPDPGCNQTSRTYGFYQDDEYLWQTTSFQPIDGMDQIVKGLKRQKINGYQKLGDLITYEAVVKEIRFRNDKVYVVYQHKGEKVEHTADYCVSNIPLVVLRNIQTPDFSKDFKKAVDRPGVNNACKVGWQANNRFWEKSDQIYGGISWVAHPITQMWYPSNDYFSAKGILTGAYNYGETARAFGMKSPEARLQEAREGARLLHPQAFSDDNKDEVPLDLGISIAWQNVPFIQACSMNWQGARDTPFYRRLLRPDGDGRFYIVGDQVSSLPGWQEGAVMSAEHVIRQIMDKPDTREKLQEDIKIAPNSADLIG